MSIIPDTQEVETEGSQFEAGKKLARPHLRNKLSVVAHPCGLRYSGRRGRRIMI
jgi:hypothetical protein